MPARPKRTPGQEASAANAEWERFAGEVRLRLWDWHDAALCDGERETAAEVFRLLQTVHCFGEEWAGITERINALAHRPTTGGTTEGEPVTEDQTPAVPAEPAAPPPSKKRIKKVVR